MCCFCFSAALLRKGRWMVTRDGEEVRFEDGTKIGGYRVNILLMFVNWIFFIEKINILL
jgi:hypothetical protein